MTRALRARLLGWALLLPLAGCDAGGPAFVYIPGPGFEQTLVTRMDLDPPGTARVGEWITLHANRLTGPWQRVPREEAKGAKCRRVSVPSGPELEVGQRIRWRVEPETGYGFNTPAPPDYERQIRFDAPGRYRVVGVSDGCGGEFTGEPMVIEVR